MQAGQLGAKIVQGERRAKEKPEDLLLLCRAACLEANFEAETVPVSLKKRLHRNTVVYDTASC